jgi:hypothetical protein
LNERLDESIKGPFHPASIRVEGIFKKVWNRKHFLPMCHPFGKGCSYRQLAGSGLVQVQRNLVPALPIYITRHIAYAFSISHSRFGNCI